MVALFVDGQKVGTLEENPDVLAKLVETGKIVEFRTPDGQQLGSFQPLAAEPFCPWEPTLTPEEARRRIAEPGGMALAEFRKRMGKA